jgi:hypothetical protein
MKRERASLLAISRVVHGSDVPATIPPPPSFKTRVPRPAVQSLPAPRISYVPYDDEAPTLKKPSLSEQAARAVLEGQPAPSGNAEHSALMEKPATIPPLVIDATVERFAASPIADASYDDFELPPLPLEGDRSVRFAAVAALFVLIAFGSATLGAAAARVQAKPADIAISWIASELPRR